MMVDNRSRPDVRFREPRAGQDRPQWAQTGRRSWADARPADHPKRTRLPSVEILSTRCYASSHGEASTLLELAPTRKRWGFFREALARVTSTRF